MTNNQELKRMPAKYAGTTARRSGRAAMGLESLAVARGRVKAAAEADQTESRQPGSLPGPGGS